MKSTGRDPLEVIARAIRQHVGRHLESTGAFLDSLEVIGPRDVATAFEVRYRSPRGSIGRFRMTYSGAGSWSGECEGVPIEIPVGRTDDIELAFVDDPQVIGSWVSVDFVSSISRFDPCRRCWAGELILDGLTFQQDGQTDKRWLTWTKGLVLHHGDRTASRYTIKRVSGQTYLFFQWKSGDVTIAGRRPQYYVLKPVHGCSGKEMR